MNPIPKITFLGTLTAIHADYLRLVNQYDGAGKFTLRIYWLFSPNFVALLLYRIAHYFHVHHLKFISWPLYLFNYYLTNADITPSTVIGEGCFLGHAGATILCGHIGRNATLHGAPGIGGGVGKGDVGAGDGLPFLGDNVTVGARAGIIGPIRIGDNATIGPMALVVRDVPAGGVVRTRSAQIIKETAKPERPEVVPGQGEAD